jgi:hypothetical protein
VRKASLQLRVDAASQLANGNGEQWLVWCDLNDESKALTAAIDGAVEVCGADSDDHKRQAAIDFQDGKIRVLVSKPSIFGFGLNFQRCHNVAFVGLSHSYEAFYQAIRRCWRFGQQQPVNAHIIYDVGEGRVIENIRRKEADSIQMAQSMVEIMKQQTMEQLKKIQRAKELHRVMMPGRLISFHCMNLPSGKERDGFIGVKDFRGDMLRIFQAAGFVFHSEVCIWKDPVTAMQRTKAIGLLHKQVRKDSALSRQGIPDYLVTVRKLGENTEPVAGPFTEFAGENPPPKSGDPIKDSINIWQRYASPVWMDINPSDTLQYRSARANEDERHICPLQLEVIRRGLQLWSNPGDVVLSPFAGIGSEGYCSLQMDRRFVGFELKPSYITPRPALGRVSSPTSMPPSC